MRQEIMRFWDGSGVSGTICSLHLAADHIRTLADCQVPKTAEITLFLTFVDFCVFFGVLAFG